LSDDEDGIVAFEQASLPQEIRQANAHYGAHRCNRRPSHAFFHHRLTIASERARYPLPAPSEKFLFRKTRTTTQSNNSNNKRQHPAMSADVPFDILADSGQEMMTKQWDGLVTEPTSTSSSTAGDVAILLLHGSTGDMHGGHMAGCCTTPTFFLCSNERPSVTPVAITPPPLKQRLGDIYLCLAYFYPKRQR
jgi:hypothetical protein